MRNSLIVGAVVLVALAILIALGTWQVQRLAWKSALIERLQSRVHQAPAALGATIDRFLNNEDVEYQPVRLRGKFLHDTEKHLYTIDKKGRSGWHIYTLMELSGGDCAACQGRNRYIYVNRGFVPYELKAKDRRRGGLVPGQVELTGLVRLTRTGKNFAEVDNQPRKNEWFWLSLKEMSGPESGLTTRQAAHLVPFFVDQRVSPQKGQWPRAGTTRVDLDNRHLGYVITWYGLALALLGVYGFFLYGNRRQTNKGET